MSNYLDVPIKTLGFSTRTVNCLFFNNINTLRQVLEMDEDELMRIPNFGRKSINEMNDFLSAHGERTIKSNKPRHFAIRLPRHVFAALRDRANANSRMAETEAAILIEAALGNPLPTISLPERVERLEKTMAVLCPGFGEP